MIRKIKILFTNSKVTFTFGIMLGLILAAGGVYAATLANSKDVTYDNSNSSLKSTDVQSAIDELWLKTNAVNAIEKVTDLYTNATKTSVTTSVTIAGGESIT